MTRAMFEANLHEKFGRRDFRRDMGPLIRHDLSWDFDHAMRTVLDELVAKLPGEPWQGDASATKGDHNPSGGTSGKA